MMSLMGNVGLLIVALVVVRISHWLYRRSNPKLKGNGKLPPGSMGFPIIGETIEFFKPCGLFEISHFFQKRMLRYGPMFRTNILGSNTVISTDSDVIFEIFRQENKSFVNSPPEAFVKIVGKDNLFLKEAGVHRHIKQTSMHLLGPEGLKQILIGTMNIAIKEHLKFKASEGTFDPWNTVANLIVSYMTPKLISNLKPEVQTKFIADFKAFNLQGFKSPFAISTWKNVYTTLKARKEATQVIRESIMARKESREKHDDFLDKLLEDLEEEGSIHNQESTVNLIFTLLFTAKDSTGTTNALLLSFLNKNKKALAELRRENEAILQNREDKEPGISWEEYRNSMPFTSMVINEALRLSNLASILFRKAVKDVQIKGYTIPAGWIVAFTPAVVHYNPEIYENPLEFNPWRWEGKDIRSGSKTLMVFGGGMRQCVGAEFAKLHLSVYLHHLVTTYDFTVVQECQMNRSPYPSVTKDLLINISPKSPN